MLNFRQLQSRKIFVTSERSSVPYWRKQDNTSKRPDCKYQELILGRDIAVSGGFILARCQVYGDISARYNDLSKDSQLVGFYREVMERRERLDRLEMDEQEAPLVVEAITTDVCRPLDIPGASQFSHFLE